MREIKREREREEEEEEEEEGKRGIYVLAQRRMDNQSEVLQNTW